MSLTDHFEELAFGLARDCDVSATSIEFKTYWYNPNLIRWCCSIKTLGYVGEGCTPQQAADKVLKVYNSNKSSVITMPWDEKPQDSVKLLKVKIKSHPQAVMEGLKAAMDAHASMNGPTVRQETFSGHPLIERYIREEDDV